MTTIFPPYDFVREIAGDCVDLKMLLKPGEESHSYEPTPQDMIAIENSDVFIYVGGENDVWVEDILSSMPDKDRVSIRLLDCVETEETLTMKCTVKRNMRDLSMKLTNMYGRLLSMHL